MLDDGLPLKHMRHGGEVQTVLVNLIFFPIFKVGPSISYDSPFLNSIYSGRLVKFTETPGSQSINMTTIGFKYHHTEPIQL
jgi:hypothetical protein